jgi:hypothetical protein
VSPHTVCGSTSEASGGGFAPTRPECFTIPRYLYLWYTHSSQGSLRADLEVCYLFFMLPRVTACSEAIVLLQYGVHALSRLLHMLDGLHAAHVVQAAPK